MLGVYSSHPSPGSTSYIYNRQLLNCQHRHLEPIPKHLHHLNIHAKMRGGGLALKSFSLFLRVIEFCCAAVILGIFSYFLANLSSNNRHIPTYERAVEGISGAAVVYTFFAFLLVCCVGGVAFFSLLAMILDLAFCGAFIYVAWANRNGAGSNSGTICTPLGCGNTNARVVDSSVRYGTAHRLESAVLAVAIIGW